MTRDWDARTYDRVADPMTRWGAAVLDRLPLDGDERVLDAGCGSGRVTELLAARLPRRPGRRARRLGVDDRSREGAARAASATGSSSSSPTSAGRCRSTGPWTRSSRPRRSTGCPTTMPSSRTWPRVLPPGGRLVAQCGGFGNIDSIKRVLASIGDGWLGTGPFRDTAGNDGQARRGGVHRHRMLADRRTDALRARRAARDVPRDGRPRGAPRTASAFGPCRVRPRGRVADAGAIDRLRPAEHPRAAVGRVGCAGRSAGGPFRGRHGRMTMSDRRRMSVLPNPCRGR